MSSIIPTACIIVIGNEILSGRTQDTNSHWLAGQLADMGVRLQEVRVIADVEAAIIDTVRECREKFTYIFTTGGIGPTHDDITALAIAKAFDVPLVLHEEARARLAAHYGDKLNEARLKMAHTPQGARLIDNPVSTAPGFVIGNVYVLAGIPSIMRAMFDAIRPLLKGGPPMLSRSVSARVTEGAIAAELAALQQAHPEIEIGSYPFMRDGKLGVSIVVRGTEEARLEIVMQAVSDLLQGHGELLTD